MPVSSGRPNVFVQAGDVGRPLFATTADNSRVCLNPTINVIRIDGRVEILANIENGDAIAKHPLT